MSPNQATEVQIQASDPAVSVWVNASAGTGKTRILTDRVLRLLLSGTAPERLLCLTFTRAAAAEMANRVNSELSRWTIQPDAELKNTLVGLTGAQSSAEELQRARQLFALVLETPGSLKIQTIHAFCDSLLARFPLESGVPSHFSVIDQVTSTELLKRATNEVFERAGTDEVIHKAIEHLSAQVSEKRFGELLHDLATNRGPLMRLFHEYSDSLDSISRSLYSESNLNDTESEERLISNVSQISIPFAKNLMEIAKAMSLGNKTDRKNGERLYRWAACPENRDKMRSEYMSVFFTVKDLKRNSLIHREALEFAPEGALDFLNAEAERLDHIKEKLRAVRTISDTMALLIIGRALIDNYEELKRSQALLDYEDLITKVRIMLSRPDIAPWVLYKLDGGLDHVLIDEAQDTNDEQWAVISALTQEFFSGLSARNDKRTIFAVGDAKQSIYSFQRADPVLFAKWKKNFGLRVLNAGKAWRAVELVHSYRSTPPILSLVDEVFRVPAAREGLVFDDTSINHRPKRSGQAGLVELWPTIISDLQDNTEAWELPVKQQREATPSRLLARQIADHITSWLENDEWLESRDRSIRPGDIMILVQRRVGFLDHMVRALKQNGIPVAGADRMTLAQQLPVMDLISLARFAVLPEDDLALAEVLKSPLFGFDDDALFEIAWDRNQLTLWNSLRKRQDRSPSYISAVSELQMILADADHMPPFELFSKVLGQHSGRRRLVSRLGPEANDPIDEFLSLCLAFENQNIPSLQGFLDWVVKGDIEVKRDLELGRNEVRVLTVHGAKGLQAPIVFLPDTCRVAKISTGIQWFDNLEHKPLLPLWPARRERESDLAKRARKMALKRQEEESRRLLYVALTRAEDRLYIGGFESTVGRPSGCWYNLIKRAMSEVGQKKVDIFGKSVLRICNRQLGPASHDWSKIVPDRTEGRLPKWAINPPQEEPKLCEPLAPSLLSVPKGSTVAPLGSDNGMRFRRGRLIHRLLELLPEFPEEKRMTCAMKILSNPSHGLSKPAKQEIADVTLSVLSDPIFAAVFGPGSRAEVAIVGSDGKRTVSGQIDRLMVSDDHILIVDYKSDRLAPELISDVPDAYLAQLAQYFRVIQRIYPTHIIQCGLLWTDSPRLMNIDTSAFEPYLS